MTQSKYEAFSLHNIEQLAMPVLVSIPHAGRFYPGDIFHNLRLPADALVRLEDRYADLLARDCIAAFAPVIVANVARAWIDLNRDENDLDIDMVEGADLSNRPAPGVKQRGGLGLIPRRLAGSGDIWRQRIAMEDVTQRIDTFHRPYHAHVSQILARMHRQFGIAILLDLHSMPPVIASGYEAAPDFVIGDQFGRSASSRFSEYLMEQIKAHGYNVNLNNPYAGDHMLRAHGNAKGPVHAIQLEVDRSLYLDCLLREPNDGIHKISQLIGSLVQGLAQEAIGKSGLLAAE
jgi:N-formylglutamate amidohydrolase